MVCRGNPPPNPRPQLLINKQTPDAYLGDIVPVAKWSGGPGGGMLPPILHPLISLGDARSHQVYLGEINWLAQFTIA